MLFCNHCRAISRPKIPRTDWHLRDKDSVDGRSSMTAGSTSAMGLLDQLNPAMQFTILAFGVFFFFGVHNFLQEAMMNIPGFKFGVMLGYLEVFG